VVLIDKFDNQTKRRHGRAVKFEWDPAKDAKLREERGLSFELAKTAWDDPNAIEIDVDNRGELRWALIARVVGKIHVVIFTRRGEVIRLITIRRAHKDEERLYEENADR
jgi:hypothetical protein